MEITKPILITARIPTTIKVHSTGVNSANKTEEFKLIICLLT
jgi:hypothetical protein